MLRREELNQERHRGNGVYGRENHLYAVAQNSHSFDGHFRAQDVYSDGHDSAVEYHHVESRSLLQKGSLFNRPNHSVQQTGFNSASTSLRKNMKQSPLGSKNKGLLHLINERPFAHTMMNHLVEKVISRKCFDEDEFTILLIDAVKKRRFVNESDEVKATDVVGLIKTIMTTPNINKALLLKTLLSIFERCIKEPCPILHSPVIGCYRALKDIKMMEKDIIKELFTTYLVNTYGLSKYNAEGCLLAIRTTLMSPTNPHRLLSPKTRPLSISDIKPDSIESENALVTSKAM